MPQCLSALKYRVRLEVLSQDVEGAGLRNRVDHAEEALGATA